MKCSECQFENADGAKFCNECGHKLELACPQCGKVNQPGSKFCNECGHNLTLSSESSPKPSYKGRLKSVTAKRRLKHVTP